MPTKNKKKCWKLLSKLPAITLLFLSGCANESFDYIYPPIVDYSEIEQQELANEIEKLDENHIITRVIIDYSQLRHILRSTK